jgi:hypothetical protein
MVTHVGEARLMRRASTAQARHQLSDELNRLDNSGDGEQGSKEPTRHGLAAANCRTKCANPRNGTPYLSISLIHRTMESRDGSRDNTVPKSVQVALCTLANCRPAGCNQATRR